MRLDSALPGSQERGPARSWRGRRSPHRHLGWCRLTSSRDDWDNHPSARLLVDAEAGEIGYRRSMGETEPVPGGKLTRGTGRRLDQNRTPRKEVGFEVADLEMAGYMFGHSKTFSTPVRTTDPRKTGSCRWGSFEGLRDGQRAQPFIAVASEDDRLSADLAQLDAAGLDLGIQLRSPDAGPAAKLGDGHRTAAGGDSRIGRRARGARRHAPWPSCS